MHTHPPLTLSDGAYTLPDAARVLRLPLPRLRTWVRGVVACDGLRLPIGEFVSSGSGRDRHFGFWTLIELFTVAELRSLGVSMPTLRAARVELACRRDVAHPFACRGLLTDGRRLLQELGDGALLELGTKGQTAFAEVLLPFCRKLDFGRASELAERYFPLGRESGIVVDPRIAFGRPSVLGTGIATETIAALMRGGELPGDVAAAFSIDQSLVNAAWEFEHRPAA